MSVPALLPRLVQPPCCHAAGQQRGPYPGSLLGAAQEGTPSHGELPLAGDPAARPGLGVDFYG